MFQNRERYVNSIYSASCAIWDNRHYGTEIVVTGKTSEIRRLGILMDLGGFDVIEIVKHELKDGEIATLVAHERTPEAHQARVAELRQLVQDCFASLKEQA